MRDHTATTALVLCLTVFVGLEAAAMSLYPGGTWWDLSAHGYHFWQNYLCDLEWSVALDGRPNLLGSRLAQVATLAFALSLVPLWWLIPRRLAAKMSARRVMRSLGWTSAAGLTAVGLLPSEHFSALHGVAVMAAGLPGTLAIALATAGLLRGARRRLLPGVLGSASFSCALADLGLYAWAKCTGSSGPMLIPLLQKIALLTMMAWMTSSLSISRGGSQHQEQ